MNLLITHPTSYKSIVIAKFIKSHYTNVKVFGLQEDPQKFLTYSKYFDEICKNCEDYKIDFLNDYIVKNSISFIFPTNSSEMYFWLKHRKSFHHTLDYWGDLSTYSSLHNKSILYKIARDLNICIPVQYFQIKEAKFPVVVKPNNLSSSKGVRYIRTKSLFENIIKDIDLGKYIIQEFVKGIGVGYSVYVKNGEIQLGYGHKRLSEFPVRGGSSNYRTQFFIPEMKNVAEKILRETLWSGFAMFEFKLTPDGQLVLIEVNPRIWGSINQGLQNGVNYFDYILPKSSMKKNISKRVNTYLSPQIYLSLLHYSLKGNFKPIFIFLKNFKRNRADVNIFNDPKGWFSMIMRKIL